ncbi:MAG: tetratricopeptide repeat protein [Proteobacteria bacterium]|nr:tetratricopeptide repeat protein [Pseudomonadota bacterium]MBU1709326.1 tetratricopeptide repeat protein [Pseudomonadota bacterium]
MNPPGTLPNNNIDQQAPVPHRSLLEEMNLPPKLIAFIRENSKRLQIGSIAFIVIIFSFIFYKNYTEKQEDQAATMLASALTEENATIKPEMLVNLIKEYPRTGAAVWSQVELGHVAYEAKNYAEAINNYLTVIGKLKSQSPLLPLINFSLGQSYEGDGKYDQALTHYGKIISVPGFTDQAYLAMGRIYEQKGDTVKAREMYQKVGETGPNWVVDKIRKLDAGKSASNTP